jgi:hypothetical protein
MKWKFWEDNKSEDFIDLTIGRIWFKTLTHDIVTRVTIKSTIVKDIINSAVYMFEMEKELLILPKSDYMKLSVKDGEKVQDKIREILKRHGLIEEKVIDNNLSEQDKVWFEETQQKQMEKVLSGWSKPK